MCKGQNTGKEVRDMPENGKEKNSIYRRHCPFIKDPSATCYCKRADEEGVRKIVAWCLDAYWDCPIYQEREEKRHMESERTRLRSRNVRPCGGRRIP
jgi:hypothetical protein